MQFHSIGIFILMGLSDPDFGADFRIHFIGIRLISQHMLIGFKF